MLKKLPQKFLIDPIIEQVKSLGSFGKRLDLNIPRGEFFGDPWEIKKEFDNTPLHNVLKSIGDVGQARLLCLESSESYTAHADPDDRIHLAIITNEFSYLVDISDKTLYHLPADGQLWYMDTSKIHVAANWGPRTRIHLNIRMMLPKYSEQRSGVRIKILNGDYDWKQISYTPLMQTINNLIKTNHITGFKAINEKEIYVNINNSDMFSSTFSNIRSKGINLEVKQI